MTFQTSPATSGIRSLVGPIVTPRAFDLTEPMTLVRIAAGLFYVPHILFKLTGIAGSLAFFAKAGLTPAPFFLGLALVVESAACVCLTFGLFPRWSGLMSAGCMAVAAYAVFATKGVGWLWNMGGVEYLAMWALVSLALSLQGWKQSTKA